MDIFDLMTFIVFISSVFKLGMSVHRLIVKLTKKSDRPFELERSINRFRGLTVYVGGLLSCDDIIIVFTKKQLNYKTKKCKTLAGFDMMPSR